jgi:hypothetical protein
MTGEEFMRALAMAPSKLADDNDRLRWMLREREGEIAILRARVRGLENNYRRQWNDAPQADDLQW